MSVLSSLRALFSPAQSVYQIDFGPVFRELVEGLTPEELYRTQPHLRIVTSFLARNVAQLGLPVFRRVSDVDRRRTTDDPVAKLLSRPNPQMTRYELLDRLVLDLCIYDTALWVLSPDPESDAGWRIQPIPPSWIDDVHSADAFSLESLTIQVPNGERVSLPMEQVIMFHGYDPRSLKKGASPIEALKQILAEQVSAWAYRQQIWSNAGRVGTVITRPAGVEWSDEARSRFIQDWKAKWTGNHGTEAGGTPILEDGMTIDRLGFNAREEEWAEVSTLALSTVASMFHVQPVMVGVLNQANFASTREFRKMLYTETLGPLLKMIEDRLNTFLVPRITDDDSVYVEFNIREKLQGDFLDEAQVLSTAVGRPWLSANEARAMQNRNPVDDGDGLVVPLNVLIGGQASPRDSGSQNLNSVAPSVKSRVVQLKASQIVQQERWGDKAAEVLRKFFKRQGAVVSSALGSKDDSDWWDEERWNSELASDLLALFLTSSKEIANAKAKDLGLGEDFFNSDQTVEYLRQVAGWRAEAVNATTKNRLDEALENGASASDVFDEAISARTASGGTALAAFAASFAVTELSQQAIYQGKASRATKTWQVNSTRPRASHAALNGETVGIDETYSNGAKWPGDSILDASEVAFCSCTSEVEIEF